MPGLFARVKADYKKKETIRSTDWEAEIDNIIENFVPNKMDDYSATTTQMRSERDPGSSGSEDLAESLAEELQSLRFVVRRLIGGTYWYSSPSITLSEADTLIDQVADLPPNRIVSGRVRSSSNQPAFLVAQAATNAATLKGDATDFVYREQGSEYTITSDVNITGLSQAPSSNNTALVDDGDLAGAEATKHQGENGTVITIDTVGSEITALVGKIAAFKINNGVDDEYFIAYVENSTTLSKCFRGFFFDSSEDPVPRITINNNDTITLLRLTWIFAKTDGSLANTTTNPVWAFDEPSSPTAGDYWFDLQNEKWKTFNGSSFIDANAILIGVTAQDSSTTVGARSFDFFNVYDELLSFETEREDNDTVRASEIGARISVYGNTVTFDKQLLKWEMSGDLVSGLTEATSTIYYLYVTDHGDKKIDVIAPYDRTTDLAGFYHPYENWRAVARIENDGSSNLDATTLVEYHLSDEFADRVGQAMTSTGADAVAASMTSTGVESIFGTLDRSTGTTVTSPDIAISAACGDYNTSSTSFVDVTNLSVTITTTGRPVVVEMISANTSGTLSSAKEGIIETTGGSAAWQLLRDSSEIAYYEIGNTYRVTPPVHLDPVAAGTYVYKIQAKGISSGIIFMGNLKLVAREV